jgi:hypothetical protein
MRYNWNKKKAAIVDLERGTKGSHLSDPTSAASFNHSTSSTKYEHGIHGSDADDTTFARGDSQRVKYLRVVVLLVWITAACVVSYGVYWYTKDSQMRQFETQFQTRAEKLLGAFENAMDGKLVAINTMANAFTTFARYSNQSFPFVTLPDFVVSGSNVRVLAEAMAMAWMPLVTDENRDEWEAYSFEH